MFVYKYAPLLVGRAFLPGRPPLARGTDEPTISGLKHSKTQQILVVEDERILSGGTDLFPSLGERPPMGNIVDISAIGSMKEIATTSDEHLR